MREEWFHQARILIIDDELTHVRFLSTLLTQRGYVRIESLTDPWQSIAVYKHFLPDIIILDLLMPGVGGMQVLKELRAEMPDGTYLPILIVTADLTPEARREALASGANDFVIKPYGAAEIIQRVGNLLETRFLYRELAVKHDETEVLVAERTKKLADANEELLKEISEQKSALASLEKTKDDGEGRKTAKDDFWVKLTEELRAPFEAIVGSEANDPQRAEQILAAGRRALELVNEARDFSAIESGQLPIALESVSVAETFREAMSLVQPAASLAGITLGASPCAQHVLADPERLKQVFVHLLSNAIKHNRVGGRVLLATTETKQNTLRLTVSDTGSGIAPLQAAKVFAPFERLGAPGGKIEGSGLGLAITKGLVELMGGAIGVETVAGEGSNFWIELPLAAKLRAQIAPNSRASAEPLPARTILYIEDNLSNLTVIERVLARRNDTKLLAAMQGQLGLDLARDHHPDLILLDLHLPDMEGDEVLERLHSDPRTQSIPVVMITADATPLRKERLMAAGACDYLTKPLDLRKLMALLDQILSRDPETSELQPALA